MTLSHTGFSPIHNLEFSHSKKKNWKHLSVVKCIFLQCAMMWLILTVIMTESARFCKKVRYTGSSARISKFHLDLCKVFHLACRFSFNFAFITIQLSLHNVQYTMLTSYSTPVLQNIHVHVRFVVFIDNANVRFKTYDSYIMILLPSPPNHIDDFAPLIQRYLESVLILRKNPVKW